MKFIKQVSKPTSITSLLLGGMSSYDPHRGADVVHASDMTKAVEFCPREFALHDKMGKSMKGMSISAALRHTFDMGRDIEARVQNDYLRDFAVGDWKCTSCDTVRSFCKAPKNGCDRQPIRCNWRYEEVRLKIGSTTAGFDLFVDVGKPKLRLIELKSIIKDDFAVLKAPLAEHHLRTNLYLRMIEASPLRDFVDTSVGHVLYIAKSYGAKSIESGGISPFKEYEVRYDKSLTDSIWDKGEQHGKYRDTGIMPTGVCTTNVCKRAKACAVRKECFGGEYA